MNIPVAIIRNTGQRIIPGHERRQQREESSGLENGRVGHIHGVAVEVGNAEQHESHVEGEEEGEEGNGRAQSAEHEEEGEDEPALVEAEVSVECQAHDKTEWSKTWNVQEEGRERVHTMR